jgi:hypothetical protein
MGGGNYSSETYTARAKARAATGASAFAYTDTVMASARPEARRAHDSLNPHGVALRECRDSADHPLSTAVSVLFDVTGSMRRVPRALQQRLNELLGVLLRKAYITDPQIMFGAIGDAIFDRAPLQVGQFESDNRMEDDLGNLYLEGGGGNGLAESYGLAMYFMARHTALDCLEKRGQKGFLFIIGDEPPYPTVTRAEIDKFLGDAEQADIPIEDVVTEVQEKYEVFYLMPSGTANWGREAVADRWRDLLGQNYIRVEDPEAICETIALIIGQHEGISLSDGVADLVALGSSERSATAAAKALEGFSASAIVKASGASEVALPPMGDGTSGSIRLR